MNPDQLAVQRGVAAGLRRPREAFEHFTQALAINPKNVEAHYNIGVLMSGLHRHEEALIGYRNAILIDPAYVPAYVNAGAALRELKRYDEAVAIYDRLMSVQPEIPFIEGTRLHCKMLICEWSGLDDEIARLHGRVRKGEKASAPFTLLATSDSPHTQLICAQTYVADRYLASPTPLWHGQAYRHDRIRVAYVSGEFREQPTAYLTAGLFECHDRRAFETYAISTGPNTRSPMRARLEQAFEHFIDADTKPDREIADLLRSNEIDIAVNLNGLFGLERTGVFALRPCPVQVNYLGFPGTMGAPYMDYIVADKIVIPPDEHDHYAETVVYLPNCYQPNDRKRAISPEPVTRADAGLPPDGFVFCCFNNSHKLMPAMFDIWMRLLSSVEGSVLWLLDVNGLAKTRLAGEAKRRGVSSERIVFAPLVPLEKHLARLRLADLVLDTLPHNAHTTASDALWAGIPALTCQGSTFAGRVAASLLHAIGLPELVTTSLAEYEALALALARDDASLAALRAKLLRNRDVCPLFDTERYTRDLEAAFRWMIANPR
jgi:protein O-GlcNAc transferase